MSHRICIVPPTKDMGSYQTYCKSSYMETYRGNAVWSYNKAREHDGLEPLTRMPVGTKYVRECLPKGAKHSAVDLTFNR
jgi:hypothetical protein